MSNLDIIFEILDLRLAESRAERLEIERQEIEESLEGFELEAVEFEPYDTEGNTKTEWKNN